MWDLGLNVSKGCVRRPKGIGFRLQGLPMNLTSKGSSGSRRAHVANSSSSMAQRKSSCAKLKRFLQAVLKR